MHLKDLTEYQLTGKRVLLRADMNVPLRHGTIANTERIDRSLPTIKHILEEGGKVILLSHLGRPEETGKVQEEFSLKPVVSYLEKKLQRPIQLNESLLEILAPPRIARIGLLAFSIASRASSSSRIKKPIHA